VSGAAAVAFSLVPMLSNDDLKYWLKAYARTVPAADVFSGKGLLSFVTSASVAPPSSTVQTWPRSTGTGSLEASRGGLHVVDSATNTELSGEVDIFGNTFDSAAWAEASAAGTSWTDGDWNGTTWTGVRWSGVRWSGVRWTSNAWSGSTWAGLRWSGVRWSGLRWSSNGWSGAGWG
jgi:serine protease AprX